MKSKIVIIENEKEKLFYKKIKWLKIIRNFGYEIKIEYKGKKYTKYRDSVPNEIEEIAKIANIINSKSRKEKYSLIYDYACDYLDNEFREKNLCGFKNDMCSCNRKKPKQKQVGSCCVRTSTKEVCEHFDNQNKRCKIKSITCKLFVCPALYKNKVRFPIKKIPYLRYFLSLRQKIIVKTNPFVDKKEMIDKLVRFYTIS